MPRSNTSSSLDSNPPDTGSTQGARSAGRTRQALRWSIGTVLALGALSLVTAIAAGPAAAPSAQSDTPPPAAAPTTAATVEKFKVDTVHSGAVFRIKHMDVAYFWGRFDSISGSITTDSANPDGLSFDITIDANSVNTGSTQRDNHLRNPDFFSVQEFPTMTFKSTSAKRAFMQPQRGMYYEVTGDLTMRGVTKPVTALVEWVGTADTSRGRRSGFEAMFTINRADFGVSYGIENGALGNEVRVIIGLEAIAE